MARKIYQLIYRRIITILVTLLCLGLVIAWVGTYCLSRNLITSQAMQHASVAVQTLNEARKLYSASNINRIRSIDGVTVTPGYHAVEGGIPNPATYTIELGDRLSDPDRGMLFRLYSNYPFPNRQLTGGPQDRFQRDALDYLEKHPESLYYRTEKLGKSYAFRYAEAVLMEPSCVACHNRLPNSPKKDWEVGQVRGAVEVTQPLDRVMLIAQDGLTAIYTALTGIIALAIAGLVLVIGRLRTINQELEEKVSERTAALSHLANLDGLTQLANRRQFDTCIQQEWLRMQRNCWPLSLILCDVDCFKKYNDTYGHQAGDDCLRAVAQVLRRNIKRTGEVAARYGGEEFAIILPNVNSFDAIQVATLIQEEIDALKIPHETALNCTYVTLSMGISTMVPRENSSYQQLIQSADKALYQAKYQGRNCFVVWGDRPA